MKKNRGFVVLIAVMVTTIVLTVGIGVLNLALREFVLANVGRDSVRAFYAADTGVECAFNYDVTEKDINGNPKSPIRPFYASSLTGVVDPGGSNPNNTIVCNGQSFYTRNAFVEKDDPVCGGRDCSVTYLRRTSNNRNTLDIPRDALCLEALDGNMCRGACVMMEVRKMVIDDTAGTQETQIIANGINDCDGDRKVERSLVLTWGTGS